MTDEDSAWLQYQIIMGKRLDLGKCEPHVAELIGAVFRDGFTAGFNFTIDDRSGDGE